MLVHASTLLPLLASLLVQASASTLGRLTAASIHASEALQAMTVDDGSSMKWTGSIFEGEEPVVLYGAADRIYNAVKAANPNYVSAQTSAEVQARTSELESRSPAEGWYLNCAVMATGHYPHLTEFDDGTSVPCAMVAGNVAEIIRNCCTLSQKGVSGHYYPQSRDYSVWVGYGNCNHSPKTYPHTYAYPGGSPNGLCKMQKKGGRF
ncbi:hypothetical protein AJ79_09896 [Helicocarpus griseus UAMH5409]|uniref:Ecp2 effector protein domain-containing protein n=1 Tax=Helicocarpus griseus UAMH5409 TaxID=1447875 RepID=A0A2B7W893_9EURO|nr:hypothetical protein AJ79_09896 [Helicocarpus griseus UAMH5409]